MAGEVYDKGQMDAIAAQIGNRIDTRTTGAFIKARYEAEADTNAFTDAEKAKLAGLESSKYRGLFTAVVNLPTVGNVDGSYADVDLGVGLDVTRYIWDNGDGAWVEQGASVGAETPATIKTKYESNADTNAYTDAEKAKLAALTIAANTNDFISALDGALN